MSEVLWRFSVCNWKSIEIFIHFYFVKNYIFFWSLKDEGNNPETVHLGGWATHTYREMHSCSGKLNTFAFENKRSSGKYNPIPFDLPRNGIHFSVCRGLLHAYESFSNLVKSTGNQILFTIHRLIWNSKRMSVWFRINRKMVNTIWFRFDLTRFGKVFAVCII